MIFLTISQPLRRDMPQRVPKRRYFNFAFPCRYRSRAPKIDGSLRDWQKRFLVPDLMTIEEREAYADISMAWNENGIYFALNLKGKVNPLTVNPAEPPKADCSTNTECNSSSTIAALSDRRRCAHTTDYLLEKSSLRRFSAPLRVD